jgi:hypothetical protein
MQILGGRWRLLRQREDQPGLMAAVAALDALGQQARATPGADARWRRTPLSTPPRSWR